MRKLVFILFTFVFLFTPTFFAFSQDLQLNYPSIPGVTTPHAGITIAEFVIYIYRLSLIIGSLIALGALIYGGFLFLTALDRPKQMAEAKERIIFAFLGLAILFGSYAILRKLDPELTILRTGEVWKPSIPVSQPVAIEPHYPKSCTQITDFGKNSDDLAQFLSDKAWQMFIFTDNPLWGPAGFLDLLKDVKDIDCEGWGQTHCRPESCSTDCIPIDCQWSDEKGNPETRILAAIEETEQGLQDVKKILQDLMESESAKKVQGTLNLMESCRTNAGSALFIRDQARDLDIINHLGLKLGDSLDFFCCTY